MSIRFLYIALFLLPLFGEAQNVNRPFPHEFMSYEFVKNDTNFNYSILSSPFFLNPTNGKFSNSLVVLDNNGYIQWYARSLDRFKETFNEFKYHPNFHIFTYTKGDYFRVLDTNFVAIDSIQPANGFLLDRHEFALSSSGNYIISGISDSVVDLSAHIFNGVRGSDTTHLMGYTIQEFDQNHNLLFEWDSNDEIDPLEAYYDFYGYDSVQFDYCHGNSIKKDLDGNYLISLRHTNSVMKIDSATGNIIWRLGGKRSDFTFVNDSSFSGQHDLKVLPNGNYTLFDNGNMSQPRRPSRAVEYQLDTANKTATKVWEYVYPSPLYARAMGNYGRNASGDQFIGNGLVFRPSPSAVFLDANDSVTAALLLRDTSVAYRTTMERLNFNLNRPQIVCSSQAGGVLLSAPSGYTSYLWSTGDTTSSILINQTGTYQVWVNQGIGMLGSEPYEISSISGACTLTSIFENSLYPREDRLLRKVDILGRLIDNPKDNEIIILIYESGKKKKVLWTNEMDSGGINN